MVHLNYLIYHLHLHLRREANTLIIYVYVVDYSLMVIWYLFPHITDYCYKWLTLLSDKKSLTTSNFTYKKQIPCFFMRSRRSFSRKDMTRRTKRRLHTQWYRTHHKHKRELKLQWNKCRFSGDIKAPHADFAEGPTSCRSGSIFEVTVKVIEF